MTAPSILIVEDNPRNRKLLRDVLGHAGYRTLEASSAEEGLLLARSERPALVLMDIQLPGIDGVEGLARLRADEDTAAIPVVAVTAFAMKDDRERFLSAGFDDYVEKPINVRELPARVAALLPREAPA
jgi:two-component system cell cycle response regulator DivK